MYSQRCMFDVIILNDMEIFNRRIN